MANFLRFDNSTVNFTEINRTDATWTFEFEVVNRQTTENINNTIAKNTNTLSSNLFVVWNLIEDSLTYRTNGTTVGQFIWAGSTTDNLGKHVYRLVYDGTVLRAYIDGLEAGNSITAANIPFTGFGTFGRDVTTLLDFYRARYWSDDSQSTLLHDWNADSIQSNGTGNTLYDDVGGVNATFVTNEEPTWLNDGQGNTAPTANAGADQTVTIGATVQLNGGLSSDPELDTLTYAWSLTAVPSGSSATLSDANIVNPTFDTDLGGTYTASLIVNDGVLSSIADTVDIVATAQAIESTLNLAITDVPDGTHPTTLVNKSTNIATVENLDWSSGTASTLLANVPVGTLFDYYVADINSDGGAGLVINTATV